MKDYTVLKWICGTIISVVALIMYFSIFPHSLDITFDITDNAVRMVDMAETIAKIQNNCTCLK